jgi:steroid 5-alpha reductase family enzyme
MLASWMLLLITGAAASVLMLALWILQRIRHDAGIVDIGWAFGLGSAAVFYGVCGNGLPERRLLVACVAGFWGFRLATYLFLRIWWKPEDGRYKTLRENRGDRAQRFFFFFFQFQALLVVLFSIPFLLAASAPGPLSWLDFLGAGIGLLSIFGEVIADTQLARFRRNPENKGKTCRAGLWRYSRHPNYFFEWIHWFAYPPMSITAAYGWASFFGPGLMLLCLFWLTGIPYTERQAVKSRGEDYREYQRTTSMFVPWFPQA